MRSTMRADGLARRRAWAFLALFGIGACDYRAMLEKLAPEPEVEFARARLADVRAGRLDDLERHLDLAASNAQTRRALEDMTRYFPAGEPREMKLIGAQMGRGPGWSSANLTFQYEFEDAWLVANVVVQRPDGGELVVKGLHLQRVQASLERVNAFTLSGKGALHYLVLALTVVVAVFSAVVFVVCVRTRALPRRWLWAIFTIVGVMGLTIDWTTGQLSFQPVRIQLFGAGAVTSGPYAPWRLTVSFPLGALMFLARRARMRAALATTSAPPPPALSA